MPRELPGCINWIPAPVARWLKRILIGEEEVNMPNQRRDPDVVIEDAGRFRSDAEALRSRNVRLPSRLAPEPEDIDRVSREHNPAWREHLRDRIADEAGDDSDAR